MKQNPSVLKFVKNHKQSKSTYVLNEYKSSYISTGMFGLVVEKSGKLTWNQLEACRRAIRRGAGKHVKIYFKVFTGVSVTGKSVASRMGCGKGSHRSWICPVRRGRIICEAFGVSRSLLVVALNNAVKKLPIRSRVVRLIY